MNKQLLLPFLFLAFMFTGCQEPDEDVDMPVPEKSVEELLQSTWFQDYVSIRYYNYAPDDKLGALLGEGKWAFDPNDYANYKRYYGFDKGEMWEQYNVSDDGATYAIIDSAGTNFIKIAHRYGDEVVLVELFEITAISDRAMTWQQVERTDKLEGENKWKKTVRTLEFMNQYNTKLR